MKQAESFLTLEAECPHCNEIQEVDWVDDSVDGLEEGVCQTCNEPFTYCHPENQYGLAR